MIQVLQFLLSISILVIIHEMGHFLLAKYFNTRVEKFYLFFNPWFSLFKFKKGETEYGLGWLPLGGYVKISGMVDESMDRDQLKKPAQPYEFRSKPAWQRLLIMLGGVIINFVAALLIYMGILHFKGQEYIPVENLTEGVAWDSVALQYGFQNGDKVIAVGNREVVAFNDISRFIVEESPTTVNVLRNNTKKEITIDKSFMDEVLAKKAIPFAFPAIPYIVDSVFPGMPAANSELRSGDKIIAIDSISTPYFTDVYKEIPKYANSTREITVLRDKDSLSFPIAVNEEGKIGILARSPYLLLETKTKKYSFLAAIPAGIVYGWETLTGYVKQMKYLFSKEGAKNVGGFGTIAQLYPKQWDWWHFWESTAFISIILAFMNILPIPALDGGHVMFLLYEVVSGRKPSDRFMEKAQIIGMALLLSLLILANGNDIIRAFG
jgi:regulator of sigma E protease